MEVAQPAQGPQVQPGALPQAQANVQVPLAAAGGGPLREQQAQVGDEISQHIGRAVQLEKMRSDQISATERGAALQQTANNAMHGDPNDPDKPGYLASRGQQAVDQIQGTIADTHKKFQDILDSAPNDDVRRMLERPMLDTMNDLQMNAQGHLMKQRDVMATNATNGAVDVSLRSGALAVGTPNQDNDIEKNYDAGLRTIRTHGVVHDGDIMVGNDGKVVEDADGHPQAGPGTQAKMDAFAQKYHSGIIDSMLAGGNAAQAQAYMDKPEVRADLEKNPKSLENMTEKVGVQVVRENAFPQAVKLYDQHGIDGQGDAMVATEKLKDKPFNEYGEVRNALKQIYSDHKQALKDFQEGEDKSQWAYMTQHQGQVQPGTPPDKAAEYRSAYDSFQKKNGVSDPTIYRSVKDMLESTDPKQRADVAKLNLNDPYYRGSLSNTQWNELAKGQDAVRQIPRGGKPPLPDIPYRIQTEVANETMIGMGMDPNATKGAPGYEAVQSFRNALDQRVSQMGEKASDREAVSQAAAHLAIQTVQGGPQGVHLAPLYQASRGAPFFVRAQDIPPADAARVDRFLAGRGIKAPTDLQRQQVYRLYLKGAGYAQ